MAENEFPRRQGLIDLTTLTNEDKGDFYIKLTKPDKTIGILCISLMDGYRYAGYKAITKRDLLTDIQLLTRLINYTQQESLLSINLAAVQARIGTIEEALTADDMVVEGDRLPSEEREQLVSALNIAETQVETLNNNLTNLDRMSGVTHLVSTNDYPAYEVANLGTLRDPINERGVDIIMYLLSRSYWVSNPDAKDGEEYLLEPEEIGMDTARRLEIVGHLFKNFVQEDGNVSSLFYEIILATKLLPVEDNKEGEDPKNS